MSQEERDRLFFKDARAAVADPGEDKKSPLIYILGVTLVFVLSISMIPYYGLAVNPKPDMDIIMDFEIDKELLDIQENNFTSLSKAANSITPSEYRVISADLVTMFVRVILILVILVITLDQWKIDTSIIYTFIQPLAWGVAAAIAVAFGWGFKDVVANWSKKKADEWNKAKK